ncbi:hypothetical protein GE21DRAFT_9059 [Neurospora crassa]|uniref:Uncharacterized protein n=1 Tax=Neurospora crassa (strain ATCC 24698 / 74-OR23-1A / CBS 708.71 / DSM 1257 / FGSC 987) TaxID=367110 RepID=V5IKQ0_NEUCR|nr:hypothetical protein NCU03848 [Neurospora crassa OR74A]XP_011394868.1 uncharacterized protein NCU03848 [Neurospora crassa OR74A]ESA42213.1 hypothetical protein NCU03848 [Neurospora crassa OR74A]ESA42214.1 hypothetical protein, variant [Neurospora crassa OR74A]KHE79953.1 hypothetical protein GE21DRAFT_9059 [Neurospora crassa]|eukprot:XP_011394867.1 hypothetical protein NCU03848 [Neurospora crassa OR74A]
MSGCPRIPRCRTCFGACLVDAGAKAKEAEAGTGRLSLITNLDHHESSLNHEHGSRSTPVAMSGVATDTVTETIIESAPQRHLTRAKAASLGHLPQKDQLIVITLALARLSEPLVHTSLQSYMFYQLQWFNPDLPDSTIAGQAGILQSVFLPMVYQAYIPWIAAVATC